MKVVANSRQQQGSSASRRLRRNGKVPGIIYGGSAEPVAVEVEHNPLYHALRVESFHSSILDMELDGTTETVLLRDVQWHPYKRQVLHIDFQRVSANEAVTLAIPLHFANEEISKAIKEQGAIISHVINEITVSCLPRDLPEYIEVDMTGMSTEHALHVSDLKLPNGVEVVITEGSDPVVATATVKGAAEEPETTETDAEAPTDGDAPAADAEDGDKPADEG